MEIYVILILGIAILLPILFLLYMQISSPPSPTTTSTTLKDKEGYVTKEVKPRDISGKVKIKESKIWSATADKKIEEGTKVRIYEVEGAHLKVEEMEEVEEVPLPEREIEEEMICPTCGSVNPLDAEECSVCGEVLKPHKEEVEEMEEVPPPPPEREIKEIENLEELEKEIEEEDICPSCGSIILIDVAECPECGEKLPEEEGFFQFFRDIKDSIWSR